MAIRRYVRVDRFHMWVFYWRSRDFFCVFRNRPGVIKLPTQAEVEAYTRLDQEILKHILPGLEQWYLDLNSGGTVRTPKERGLSRRWGFRFWGLEIGERG